MAKSNKSSLALTREQFRTAAKPVSVTINGIPMVADRKEFSTGSLGWYLNAKMSIEIDGQVVPVQIGMNMTIVGSKDIPEDRAAAPAPAPPAATTHGSEASF